jgi:phasin family protein
MATNATPKIDAAAEKAYAEAAAKETSSKKDAEVKAVPAKKAPKTASKKTAPKKAAAKKTVAKKAVKKKAAAKKVAVKKKIAARKTAPKKAKPAAKTNSVIQLKDTIMAKANTTDFAKTAKELAADVQTRVKTAYAKTGELASEATEFNKGNVEALVESGKILFAGVQELGREDVDSGKAAIETVTADVKKMTSVQSPTEFMQLQGELARRNFDAAIAFGSKRSEELVKLYNNAFAPISNRVSLAAEKVKKAA